MTNLENVEYIISTSPPIRGNIITVRIDVYKKSFKIIETIKKFLFFKKEIEIRQPIITVYLPLTKIGGQEKIVFKLKEKFEEIINLLWKENEE